MTNVRMMSAVSAYSEAGRLITYHVQGDVAGGEVTAAAVLRHQGGVAPARHPSGRHAQAERVQDAALQAAQPDAHLGVGAGRHHWLDLHSLPHGNWHGIREATYKQRDGQNVVGLYVDRRR